MGLITAHVLFCLIVTVKLGIFFRGVVNERFGPNGCFKSSGKSIKSLEISDVRARSSTGQSIGLRIRGLGVRIPSGAPSKVTATGADDV
jgi:hypothetical protein